MATTAIGPDHHGRQWHRPDRAGNHGRPARDHGGRGWAYFDVVALFAARHFQEATGHDRVRTARDSYSYLHLLMIAAIVPVALGVKKTLAHVEEPLESATAFALMGGVAVYLIGHIAFRLRNVGTISRPRLVAALACGALTPIATSLDALAALALAAAILIALISYEAIAFREARERLRRETASGRR